MRHFITCLGYNTPEMIRGALENFEQTTTDYEHRRCVKTLFNPGYPGNKESELKRIAAEFGWWFANIENKGVMENHNVAIHEYCHMEIGDTYTCWDPDVRMQQRGWLSTANELLEAFQDCVFVCAAQPFHDEDWCAKNHGRSIKQLHNGTKYASYKQLIAWSTGVWKGEWLAKRPRDFKAAHPIYGWTEHADVDLMQAHGKTWLSLVDHYDHHLGASADYAAWKIECAQGKTVKKFDEWLKEKK